MDDWAKRGHFQPKMGDTTFTTIAPTTRCKKNALGQEKILDRRYTHYLLPVLSKVIWGDKKYCDYCVIRTTPEMCTGVCARETI